ncbi:MAG: serine hydrolase domain-containing protein [Vicinamibacterales bacterium]
MKKLLSFVVTALLVGTPAHAQDTTNEIDKIFSWATPATPGCAVAASQHGKLVVNRAYGLADLERNVPITPDTIFDAASIRKQFIAAAVLLLVEEGRLSLSDDVRKFVPELPDYAHKITLDHMLTHTSGLRDWVPLLNFANGDYPAWSMILRQRSLTFAPGEEWSYSNSGYVLLVEVVARTSGMSFAEFARKRLFEPLGMKSTSYVDDLRFVVKNRALAYEKGGDRWRMDMLLGNDRGGGALFSTAADLVIWNDALTNARLGKFVSEKLQEPATLNNGRKLSYARGLGLDANYAGRVIWHAGGGAGYRSVLARYPEQGFSIAVMCNAGESADDRDGFAARIFDLFVSPTGTRPAAPTPPAAPPVEGLDVNSKAGLFFNEGTGEPLRLIVNNGRLAVAGGGPLAAVTKDRFRNPRASTAFMSQDSFELNFLSQAQFELKSMEGKTTRYRRAQPYAPTADDLKAFAGRFESDELRAVFDITPAKDGLTVRLNESTTLEFRPVDRDTFQRGMMTVRFNRDAAGRVVGLNMTNPVLRNIKFTRLNDPTGRR